MRSIPSARFSKPTSHGACDFERRRRSNRKQESCDNDRGKRNVQNAMPTCTSGAHNALVAIDSNCPSRRFPRDVVGRRQAGPETMRRCQRDARFLSAALAYSLDRNRAAFSWQMAPGCQGNGIFKIDAWWSRAGWLYKPFTIAADRSRVLRVTFFAPSHRSFDWRIASAAVSI